MAKIDDPSNVGDFSKPVVHPSGSASLNSRIAAQATKATPVEERLDAADAKLAEEAEKISQSIQPQQTYEDRLKEVNVTKDEAAHIIDAMLEKGFYQETVALTSRVTARFRTRQFRDVERLHTVLEAVRPVFEETRREITYKYCLAGSLAAYRDVNFEFPSPRKATKEVIDKAFQARLDFIEEMNDPVLRLLYAKLAKFDLKISVVCEEGAIENF